MNGFGIQAAIKALVAEILENGVINGIDHPGNLRSVGKFVVVPAQFVAQEQPLFVFGTQAVVLV